MSLHPPTDRSATREPAPERHGLAIVAPVTVNHPRVWAAAIALGFALAGPAAFGTASAEFLHEPAAAVFQLHGSDRLRPERAVVLDLPVTVVPLQPGGPGPGPGSSAPAR